MSNDFNSAFNRILKKAIGEKARRYRPKKIDTGNTEAGRSQASGPSWREGKGFVPEHASWNIREYKGTPGRNRRRK